MKLVGVEDEYILYGMIFALSNRIQTIGDNHFKDITMKQHFMLIGLQLFNGESPTLKDMGELIGCSYQNVKRMAISLERNGFIEIVKDEKDKRKLRLVPTNKVEEFGRENMKETTEFMKKMYKDVDKENIKITIETLMKLDQNLGGILQ